MTAAILTLNAGSSSLKFALFDAGSLTATVRGEIENLGEAPHLRARDAAGAVLAEQRWPAGLADPYATALDALMVFAQAHLGGDGLGAVGHRVVHGGTDHGRPERLTPTLMAALVALTPLDPLHMAHNLAPMRVIAASRPALPQVACFDTAFHHTMPPVARCLALPRAIMDAGVQRYGFHGLSYEYIASQLVTISPGLAAGRVIVAHLGSGASLCALQAGRSIETTMGFSALDGLVMGTRSGSLDPGAILYLGAQGHSFADITDMLYRRSGLLGVSGISDDMRVLLASDDSHAKAALDLFSYRMAGLVGSLTNALGGLDGLVFTAGIGEHAAPVRASVCARLAWLGVRLDGGANAAGAGLISAADSTIEIRVIPTDEEAMIARHTRAILRGKTA
jgi:acetate kinase